MDPYALRPQDIQLSDVAHHLSMVCRFGGGVRRFYSVAEHCVRVSFLVPPEDRLWGLLHDGPEYVLGDIKSPTKNQPDFQGYRDAEEIAMRSFCIKFGLPFQQPRSVHVADVEARNQEGMVLVPGWTALPTCDTYPPIRGLAPFAAKKQFLDRFSELTSLRRAA